MRTDAQTAMIENRLVHLPESAPWLVQRPNEVTVAPHGRHDDQVDATAQIDARLVQKRGSGPS
jgi:phage terminase large subunit-like protein